MKKELEFSLKIHGKGVASEVLSISGFDAISEVYQCSINLLFKINDFDEDAWIFNEATLTISNKKTSYISGIITEVYAEEYLKNHVSARVVIKPKLYHMHLQTRTEVHLDKSIPQIIKEYLQLNNISKFRFDLQGSYPRNEFVCQYEETDFNFFSRWLEREGIFYYFEQSDSVETLILTDTNKTLQKSRVFKEGVSLNYQYPKNDLSDNGLLSDFKFKRTLIPHQINLIAYNPEQASKKLTHQDIVDDRHGQGTVKVWVENVKSNDEVKKYAKIAKEMFLKDKDRYLSKSDVLSHSGLYFNLKQHPNPRWQGKNFLIIKTTFEGTQASQIVEARDNNSESFFNITNHCVDLATQFRSSSKTPIPRIPGVIPGFVDGQGEGEDIELNDKGCYKVKFAILDNPPGKGSNWIRKMESYIGDKYGHHLPLHKGDEIALGFIYGNPDMPIITGCLHNSVQESYVDSKNQKLHGMKLKNTSSHTLTNDDIEKGYHSILVNHNSGHQSTMVYGNVKEAKHINNAINSIDTGTYQHTTGDSQTTTLGDTHSTTDGNATYITGSNLSRNVSGKITEKSSHKNVHVAGASIDTCEYRIDTSLINETKTCLGTSEDIKIGLSTDIKVGAWLETTLGWSQDIHLSPNFKKKTIETHLAGIFNTKAAEYNADFVSYNLKAATTNLTSATTTIESADTSIEGETLTITADVILTGNVTIVGATNIVGDTTITGDAGISGMTTISGGAEITGSASIIGNTSITGNTAFMGDCAVCGEHTVF